MKQNLVVLLADIFNLFEIHPVQCVDYPEAETASGELQVSYAIVLLASFASVFFP